MKSKGLRGLVFVVISLAVLVAVGAVAYNVGMNAAGTSDHTFFGPMMRGRGMYFGGGPGWWLWGIVPAVLIGLGIVWLLVALFGGTGRNAPTTVPGPTADGVDRLRELSEMRDRGALSDDEFAAAKRKLLGL